MVQFFYYISISAFYWISYLCFSDHSRENAFYLFLIYLFGAYGIFPVVFRRSMTPPYSSLVLVPGRDRVLRGFYGSFFIFALILAYFSMVSG